MNIWTTELKQQLLYFYESLKVIPVREIQWQEQKVEEPLEFAKAEEKGERVRIIEREIEGEDNVNGRIHDFNNSFVIMLWDQEHSLLLPTKEQQTYKRSRRTRII